MSAPFGLFPLTPEELERVRRAREARGRIEAALAAARERLGRPLSLREVAEIRRKEVARP